jgi:general stress protein YciG
MATNQHDFAAMDPEQQRCIASKGGRASHDKGGAHEWDSQEPAETGRKGGQSAHEAGRAHEWDSEEAAEGGRRGGLASHGERVAFHHEAAAHHHTQAARHRSQGTHERADLHAEAARSPGRQADEWGERASRRSNRGFAAMDPDRQREIASEGGRAPPSRRGFQAMDPDEQGHRNLKRPLLLGASHLRCPATPLMSTMPHRPGPTHTTEPPFGFAGPTTHWRE